MAMRRDALTSANTAETARRLRWRSFPRQMLVLRRVMAAVAVIGLCGVPSSLSRSELGLAFAGGDAGEAQAVASALRSALDSLSPLQKQVEAGRVIGNFGKKAEKIIERASADGADIERTLDGALQALFFRQLASLRSELFRRYEGTSSRTAETIEKADKEFVRRAEALVREGSSWSFEVDRELLRSSLEGTLRREAALAQERRRGSLTRRTYFTLLGRMQKQLDKLGESLRGSGGASPWMVWTSYRIPKTPVLVSGRYQPGRTNVAITLAADEDPANAEANFVQGFRPSWLPATNLGVSVDFGF
eukprot:TRINITY_DN76087_c0_g1_i1.p1 TRINITY_DN76087_c0_g1~~TRINITY_DN76087_c0_g1_i1.p1  ORF type:complete len:305 (+),score=77.43 TRINITY_DN76087_c0_g1_i1:118-1032(+)